MSSEEGVSQNRTAPEDETIKTCYILLRLGDFIGVRHIVNMNQLVSSKRHDDFEKVGAIADVLHPAESRLQHVLLDYYGTIKVTPPGPVLREDFEKLMNLFYWRHNRFPFCQEAGVRASLAWSFLSSPTIKAVYDYVILDEDNLETQGNVLGYSDVGGSQSGDGSGGGITVGGLCGDEGIKGRVDKRKRKRDECESLAAGGETTGSAQSSSTERHFLCPQET